ncbi:MAG: response regulator [Rhodospirillaceae bacterium]|nr:response regulator [Rhodospirillaceae bacterium]
MSQEPLVVTAFDRLRFIVIDDDRVLLQLVEAFLNAAAAGGVIPAVSCFTALNLLADKTKKIDCIICDHSMPAMTGLALLQEIRGGKHPNIPREIPFIMLTSSGQEEVVRAAVALDAHGYIRKPVSKDILVKAIHRAFNRQLNLKKPEDYLSYPLPAEP